MKESNSLSSHIEVIEETLTKIKSNFSSIKEEEKALQSLADNMSLLASSDDDLMTRYQENLAAFEEYHPEIFEFFKNYVPTKYIVDASDGFVNALDVNTGEVFYKYPSFLTTKLQFDKFALSPNIKKFNFDGEEGNEAKFLHVDSVDAMIALLPEKNSNLSQKHISSSNHFSSLMLFGVGAGYHIELVAQQYDVACLYIIEPDLDLFFLSLFSINWRFILTTFDQKGSQVHISLGKQKETFFDDLMKKSAINGRYQMAHVAGYIHYRSEAISELLTEFNCRYLEMGRGWGFFDDAVMAISHTLGNIKQQVPLLKKDAANVTELSEVPVFIVGNGPSLDGLVDVIKAHQGKVIIISCGSVLSALYKYGIKPDFHCEQERTSPVTEKVTHYCPADFLEGIIFLAPTTVHPDVFLLFERSIMAAKANEPSSVLLLHDSTGKDLFASYHFINPTVANTALVMGYNLGFKNFYLFGVDLGHKKGGFHHSKKSLYYNEEEKDCDLYSVKEDQLIEVDGNYGGTFLCDSFFCQSNSNLSKQIIGFDDLNCFNLSDGAKIKGSIPMLVEELALSFDDHTDLDKTVLLAKVYKKSAYIDENLELHQRLIQNLDYEFFDAVCENLVKLNERPITEFKEAVALLLTNTSLIRNFTEQVHDILIGSVMHFQVVLTQLLYGSAKKEHGLEKFIEGLTFFRNFLKAAPTYYRDNAENAHYIENTQWMQKLRKK